MKPMGKRKDPLNAEELENTRQENRSQTESKERRVPQEREEEGKKTKDTFSRDKDNTCLLTAVEWLLKLLPPEWQRRDPTGNQKEKKHQQTPPQSKEGENKESGPPDSPWCEDLWAEVELWGQTLPTNVTFCGWRMYRPYQWILDDHPRLKERLKLSSAPEKVGERGERSAFPSDKVCDRVLGISR